MLLQLRSYQQESGNMRNPVEMGPLLKSLTEVQKIEDLPDLSTIEKPAQVASTQIKPTVKKPVAFKKQVITPVDVAPVEPTNSDKPITTTLQGNEFTSSASQQAGMPEKEEPAMMEQKIVYLKF
jgi:hypothetical protein